MSIEKHNLLHEFPEHKETIHELKINNNHFARKFEEYHNIEHETKRIEQGVETPSDQYVKSVKTKRVQLKDELFDMIKEHTKV